MSPSDSVDGGAVLGIDVGWSTKRSTTGLCLLEWQAQDLKYTFRLANSDNSERLRKLKSLAQDKEFAAVALDGPLGPGLGALKAYRPAEALLSGGLFQQRGKPGQTNSPNGQRLHEEATQLARLVMENYPIALATHTCNITDQSVVEAFPTSFLSVLVDDEGFPGGSNRRRKSDIFFRLKSVQVRLSTLIQTLLPQLANQCDLSSIKGHDRVAAFICALTALCVVKGQYVGVGDGLGGWIVLPPLSLWGRSAAGSGRWAKQAIMRNILRAQTLAERQNSKVEIYSDNLLLDL